MAGCEDLWHRRAQGLAGSGEIYRRPRGYKQRVRGHQQEKRFAILPRPQAHHRRLARRGPGPMDRHRAPAQVELAGQPRDLAAFLDRDAATVRGVDARSRIHSWTRLVSWLEIQFIDVVSVDDQRITEDDLTSVNAQGAEAAGVDGGGAGWDLALRQESARVHCQIAEVARAPEHDGLHHAFVHVGLADARQREADHVYIFPASLADRLTGAGNRGSGNRHDQLHRRVDFEERLRFGEGLIPVVIAGTDCGEL